MDKYNHVKAFISCNKIVIRSVSIFGFLVLLWLITYPRMMDAHALDWLMKLVAGLTGYILFLLGNPIAVRGSLVYSPAFSMEVGNECTGIVPMVLLFCAIVAYPARLKEKAVCMAFGLSVIFFLNLVRTTSLYYIGIYLPQYFGIAHFVVWQSITILAMISIWLLWIGRVVRVRAS